MAPKFSIDISGVWSPRRARRIIEALEDETKAQGLALFTVDVTVHGRVPRVMIVARPESVGAPDFG